MERNSRLNVIEMKKKKMKKEREKKGLTQRESKCYSWKEIKWKMWRSVREDREREKAIMMKSEIGT